MKGIFLFYILTFLIVDSVDHFEAVFLIVFWVTMGALIFENLKGSFCPGVFFDINNKNIICIYIFVGEKYFYAKRSRNQMPMDSIKRLIVLEKAAKFLGKKEDAGGLFILMESTFSNVNGNIFVINHFEFSQKRHLKDYLDGVLAILDNKIEIDYLGE